MFVLSIDLVQCSLYTAGHGMAWHGMGDAISFWSGDKHEDPGVAG
jgi:hypothetical protein